MAQFVGGGGGGGWKFSHFSCSRSLPFWKLDLENNNITDFHYNPLPLFFLFSSSFLLSFLQAVPRASLLRPKILCELFRQGGVKYRSPTNTECSCHSFYFSPAAAYVLCHHSTNNVFTGGAWRLRWRNYVENRKSAQRSHKELSPKDPIRALVRV